MHGADRARWLVLAAVSIGVTGIWVMHFIAMLGFTIPGQVITYNVPVTIGSMLIAVGVVGIGLFTVGFGGRGPGPLLLGGTIIGLGVASMHYVGMWALRMPDTMSYNTRLVAVSVAIAIVAGTVALWAALRLTGPRPTIIASLIMGVAVSGMHYTGMAAMRVQAAPGGGMASMGGGARGSAFLLPLILGITVLTFLVTAIVTLAPTEAELRADEALMERIARRTESTGRPLPGPLATGSAPRTDRGAQRAAGVHRAS